MLDEAVAAAAEEQPAAPLAGATVDGADAQANRPGPPHEWVFGSWTGGLFPVSEVDPAACFFYDADGAVHLTTTVYEVEPTKWK